MMRRLILAIFVLAAQTAWTAPLIGGMIKYRDFSGSIDITVSERDYRFQIFDQGDLIVRTTGEIGTPMSFDTYIISFYTVEAVIGDKYYPELIVSPPRTRTSEFHLDTDEVILTDAFVYRVPFEFFGFISAYASYSNPGECILCVGVRGEGVGTVTTWAPQPNQRIPHYMTFAWGDYANIPEPGTFALGAIGVLALAGCQILRSRRSSAD